LLASQSEPDRQAIINSLSEAQAKELQYDWKFWGRPSQLEPEGNWLKWLILAGRGFGKTRAGAEWLREQVKSGRRRIAIIAETQKDLESVLVEGDSGIMSVFPPHERPKYTKKPVELVFPNGAVALGYNGSEPDQLRGPNFDAAWLDELAKWRYAQEAWDMLQFALRLGDRPRQLITTTPRPIPLIRALMKDPTCIVTRGNTYENRGNLAASFIKEMETKYAGTRLGRQELEAAILDDSPNALWRREKLDEYRVKAPPPLKRILVAIDPAAKSNEMPEDGAATGISVSGLGEDGRGYILEDATTRAGPNGWARLAVSLYDRYEANAIVVETNQGGDMVKSVISSVRPSLPIIEVIASKGKWVRAEPIAALYEQGRISHVGTLADLEDEMVMFGVNGLVDGTSPDRLDALVWGLTELFPQIIRPVAKPKAATHHASAGGWMG
jgi:phage terminase large subunit-like protein